MVSTQDLIISQNKLDPILWVGHVSQTDVPGLINFNEKPVSSDFEASIAEASKLISKKKYSAIFVLQEPAGEALEFLYLAKIAQPMAARVLMSSDFSEAEVREGINRAQVKTFLKWPAGASEIQEVLNNALEFHTGLLSRSLLIRESSHQNKQLEALTNSLEAMVEERTQYIEASHKEESDKLTRERNLIRFIKDLGLQTSFEDILAVLRKELRKLHKMGDPILAFRLIGRRTFFLSFHSGHFTETEATEYHAFPTELGMPDSSMVRYFANHFGRPFVKALVFPIDLRLTRQFTQGRAEAILCVENSLTEKEAHLFNEFIGDRIGPLSMALDRVLLERQLSSFSYRWEKTFDGMRDPIAIVDVDFNVVRANRKFSQNLIYQKCFKDFSGGNEVCDGCPIKQVLKEGVPATGQVHIHGRIYQVHSYPVLFKEGQRPTNVVNQYVDVTESRELYLRMLQSEKMGAIGMLAGNIAHELNNPLTGLRSLAQVLLQEADKNSTLYSDLIEIEKATARSQRIIKNLLDFSKAEDQPLELVTIDEVVEKTLPMLKSAMRNHRLFVELDAATAKVNLEIHLVQQVVFNLVNNACQAMKEGGKLEIRSFVKANQVHLEIRDSGPGIPEAIRAKIFEPFFTTKKEGLGTGLGLSMSKSVIERFGGSISLRDVAEGTCFVIRLPIKS